MQAYRTVFISDVHLGIRWCKAKELAAFLSSLSCERLYLVGDLIDGWQLQRKSSWPRSHNRVLQELLRISRKSPVVYITGNHDNFMDEHHGTIVGNISICENAVHTTAEGKRMLVIHGDEFDAVMTYGKWVARLGDVAYNMALWINCILNAFRSLLGMRYWSLSQYLKHRVKDVVNVVSEFEKHLSQEMKQRDVQGVICGHIHRPALKQLDGGLYANCGDWVESCSALVEHFDGTLEIVRWHDEYSKAPKVTAQGELVMPREAVSEEVTFFEDLWSLPK